MMQGKVQKTNASRRLFTRRPWSILRHSFGFSTAPSCIDSNTCSILRQPFETRNESQGRQSSPPSLSPSVREPKGSVPNRLGAHRFQLASIAQTPKIELSKAFGANRPLQPPCGTDASAPKKSHIFLGCALPFSQTDV